MTRRNQAVWSRRLGLKDAMLHGLGQNLRYLLVAVALLLPVQSIGQIVWSADMETGDISQWDHNAPWRSGPGLTDFRLSTTQVHGGRHSLATSIDTRIGTAGIRWARRYITRDAPLLPDEAYYSAWFYLPGPFKSQWWNFMQWKRSYQRPNGGSSDPVASVNFEERAGSDALYFALNYKVGNDGGYKTPGWGNVASSPIDVPLRQWVHLECKYRWSTVRNGEITCWQDGQQIWSLTGIKTEFDYVGDAYPRQFSVNAYASEVSPAPYTFYLDDVAISLNRLGLGGPATAIEVAAVDSTISPGSILSLFGSGFTGDGTFYDANALPLPVELGGTSVTVGGLQAPLFAVWPQQIVLQVPWEVLVPPGFGSVAPVQGTVKRGSLTATFEVGVTSASPSLLTIGGDETGQALALIAGTSDFAAPVGMTPTSRPAKDDEILVVYATGLGAVSPLINSGANSCDPESSCAPDYSNVTLRRLIGNLEVLAGGQTISPDDVLYAGLDPTYVGLYQIHFRVGSQIPSGDQQPLTVQVDGVPSQSNVTISIE